MKTGPSRAATGRPVAPSLPGATVDAAAPAPAAPSAGPSRRVPPTAGPGAPRTSAAAPAPAPRARLPGHAGRGTPAVDRPLARVVHHLDAEVVAPMATLAAALDLRFVESQERLVALIEAVGETAADRSQSLAIFAELEKRSPDVMLREIEDGGELAALIDGALASNARLGVPTAPGRQSLAAAVRDLDVAWRAWLAPAPLSAQAAGRADGEPAPDPLEHSIGDALEACFDRAATRRRDLIVALQAVRMQCRDDRPDLGNALVANMGFHLWLEFVVCNIGIKCNDLQDGVARAHVRLLESCRPGQPRPVARDAAQDADRLTLGALKSARMAALARWSIDHSLHDDRGRVRAHSVVARIFADAAMTHADVLLWHVGSGRGVAAHLEPGEMDFLEQLALQSKRVALQVENLLLQGDATRHAKAIESFATILGDEIGEMLVDLDDACNELRSRSDAVVAAGNDHGRLLPDTLGYLLALFEPLQSDLPKVFLARPATPPLADDLREELQRVFRETLDGAPLDVAELSARALTAVEARRALAFTQAEEAARRAMAELLQDLAPAPPPAGAGKGRTSKKAKSRGGARRAVGAKPAAPETPAPASGVAAPSVSPKDLADRRAAARQSIAVAMADARAGRRLSDAIRQLPRVERQLRVWLARAGVEAMTSDDRARLSEDCDLLRATRVEIDHYFKGRRLLSAPEEALFLNEDLRARIEVKPGIHVETLAEVSFFGAQRQPDKIMEIELFLRSKATPAAELFGPPLDPVSGTFWLHVHTRDHRRLPTAAHFKNAEERKIAWREVRDGEFQAVHRGPVQPSVFEEILRLAGPRPIPEIDAA